MNFKAMKLIFLSLFAINTTYAFEKNFMIDNQSSCKLILHPSINKTFIPGAPNEIKSFTQTPIKYIVNNDSMNKTLLRYDIYCNSSYVSGNIFVKTKSLSDGYSVSQYVVSFEQKLKMNMDKNNNVSILYK